MFDNPARICALAGLALMAAGAPAIARAQPQRLLDWPGKTVQAAQAPQSPRSLPAGVRPHGYGAPVPSAFAPTPSLQPQTRALVAPATPAAPPSPAALAADRPRLYSLHRDYGEQPDRTPLPEPVYLDHLPVDLAAPPPEPLRGEALKRAQDDAKDPDPPQSGLNQSGLN